MKSNLSITAHLPLPPLGSAATRILLPAPILSSHKQNFAIKCAASSSNNPPFLPPLKAAACAVIFSAATFWKLPAPALAQLPILSESVTETIDSAENSNSLPLKSSSDSIHALKALLEEKLHDCDDKESLSVLRKLASAEPENEEWRCMAARMLTEMGRFEEASFAFEEVLSRNPLNFENALVEDRRREREAVLRDVRMIMAQMSSWRRCGSCARTWRRRCRATTHG